MNFKKLISLFLAVLMLCGVLTSFSVITVSAEEETTTEAGTGTAAKIETEDEKTARLQNTIYPNPEAKLASMKKMSEKGHYAIYADQSTGEVAVKDTATGQILFSNPYDIGYYPDQGGITSNVKSRLMSQIIVQFKEVESDNKKNYTSFEYAAVKDQIKVKNIKNGIRVEYTIGREEARRLVPRQIEKTRFEDMIRTPMEEYYGITADEAQRIMDNNEYDNPLYASAFYFRKQLSYFVYKDKDLCTSDRLKQDLLTAFPICSKFAIYILEPSASTTEIEKIEEVIKSACPNYSYEEMDYDHQLTEFSSEEENPPLFKMALEYTLDETGFNVRLPANGIRFNESKFELLSLQVLPYMGAGNNAYDGYAFFPDGSGALFAFEDMKEITNETITAKIYGEDYAYHKLDMEYQQVVRYPVFGIVEDTRYYDCVYTNDQTGDEERVTVSGVIYDQVMKAYEDGTSGTNELYKQYGKFIIQGDVTERIERRGFSAVVEEGDALTSLSYVHEGTQAPYDTVSLICSPRPRDEYNLADAISVGDNKTVSVVCKRKYVGSYKLHFTMLSDDELVEKAIADSAESEKPYTADDFYEASWLGMAIAYRDHLVKNGTLSALEATNENIPLYIESFGAMETVEKILSIPVEVKRPLTSAQDILTMYEQLSTGNLVTDEDGNVTKKTNTQITNINFKLTGYANGGMYSTIPYGLEWEDAVSEELTMQELFDKAADINASGEGHLGLFPDFDFSYVTTLDMFDGFSMRNHAVRTIDDLYSYKREYMATQQRYAGYFQLAVSPAYFSRFYTKLMDNYLGYENVSGISVGSLGTALNSDFDEDEPYNREDAKSFVMKALEFISGANDGQLEVMVDGGNAYTWQYADHILGVSLDSSRYIVASYSVPFLGVVLHGYMNFTGEPLNMEGDLNYAKLKAIENGASIYFTLSYQNTQNLKEDYYYNQYYSVRYDIWQDDVVELYDELNGQLSDVQNMLIIDHEFLTGMRVPDTDELDRDLKEEFDAVMDFQANQQAFLDQMKADAVADARDHIIALGTEVKNRISASITNYGGQSGAAMKFVRSGKIFTKAFSEYMSVKLEYDAIVAAKPSDEVLKQAQADLDAAKESLVRSIKTVATPLAKIDVSIQEIEELMATAQEGAELIDKTEGRPQSIVDEVYELIEEAEEMRDELMGTTFEYSATNLELQTFLYLHFAMASYYTGVEIDASCDMETIYTLFGTDAYGLYYEELEILKFLPANEGKSDDELIARYNLKKGEPSLDGFVQYVKDILGDTYAFDPILVATDGVDANILEYFENVFSYSATRDYRGITATDDRGIFAQYFDANPDRYQPASGSYVSNLANIKPVFEEIKATVDFLVKKDTGRIYEVDNGDYKLESVATQAELEELIGKIVQILENNDRTNAKAQYPIEFYHPENHAANAENYLRVYYYYSVMSMLVPSGAEDTTLALLTVESTATPSIDLIINQYLQYDKNDSANQLFIKLVDDYKADAAAVEDLLEIIDAELTGNYDGSKLSELKRAYLIGFSKIAAKITTVKLAGEKKEDKKDEIEAINDEATAMLAGAFDNVTDFAQLDAIIADVVALHDNYTVKDSYDIQETSTAYVYYSYFKHLSGLTAPVFYYDAYLAKADAAVQAEVEKKIAEIRGKLGNEYTNLECVEAIFASLGDKEDPLYDFIDEVADQLIYTPEKKGTIADDILQHYCNTLFDAFGVTSLGSIDDLELTIGKGDAKTARSEAEKYIAERVPEFIKSAKSTAKGQMPNYVLSAFTSETELKDLAVDVIEQKLVKLEFVTADKAEDDALIAQVIDLIRFCYYKKVMDNLDVDKAIDFNVYAAYGDSLEESAARVKNIIYYHVMNIAGAMEKDELDRLFVVRTNTLEEEEDGEVSRYLSDDGRIVSVTYGQPKDGGGYKKYKTFVLNYNNFSVNVVYEGITYTIPAYGYVVVMHDAASS